MSEQKICFHSLLPDKSTYFAHVRLWTMTVCPTFHFMLSDLLCLACFDSSVRYSRSKMQRAALCWGRHNRILFYRRFVIRCLICRCFDARSQSQSFLRSVVLVLPREMDSTMEAEGIGFVELRNKATHSLTHSCKRFLLEFLGFYRSRMCTILLYLPVLKLRTRLRWKHTFFLNSIHKKHSAELRTLFD